MSLVNPLIQLSHEHLFASDNKHSTVKLVNTTKGGKMLKIKWGLGYAPRLKRNVKLWHVVVNGRTLSTHISERDAKAWAYDYMHNNPHMRHDPKVQKFG